MKRKFFSILFALVLVLELQPGDGRAGNGRRP